MRKSIFLVDCNWFYVACEQAFNYDLLGKPVVVLSNCDGMPISRNTEAKALGIKMAEPWFKIKEEAERAGVIARSSNYTLYAERSYKVMDILSEYSPNQEVYSIDECFLDMTGIRGDHTEAGRRMKAQIQQELDLPTCVGIASTKTLAKTANHYAKKHPDTLGVCNFNNMTETELDALLASIEVNDVWGVGRRLAIRLAEFGIHTTLDLKRADPVLMCHKFSVVMEKTIRELNGDICIDLEEVPPAKKQIVSSRSFGYKVGDKTSLEQSIAHHVQEGCRKLREQRSYASTITVFFHTSPHSDDPPHYANKTFGLEAPINDTMHFTRIAIWMLNQMYKPGFRYMKAGIGLGGIIRPEDEQPDQSDLFGFKPVQDDKSARLMMAVDSLNAKYGRGTVRSASQGFTKHWEMKRELLSPEYTTKWSDIIVAR